MDPPPPYSSRDEEDYLAARREDKFDNNSANLSPKKPSAPEEINDFPAAASHKAPRSQPQYPGVAQQRPQQERGPLGLDEDQRRMALIAGALLLLCCCLRHGAHHHW